MNIGIEAERANNPVKTGVEHYAKELIVHLAKIDQKNNYTLYLREQPESWFFDLPKNFVLRIIPFPKFWTQLRVSYEMFRNKPDVLFVPASALPLIHPNSVITIHDIAWIHFPEAFTGFMKTYLNFSTFQAVTNAKKIIAVSEATKNDLIKKYRLNSTKIVVVPHGYESSPKDFNNLSDEIRNQLPEKYVLFLSTLQPRKNLEKLITAFRLLKEENPDLPHKLVVVGKPGWKFEQILRTIDENKDIVVYLKHISDSDRWPVYNKADVFVYPSLYEGFGMPLLEAFECEVPAAVANNSSLPEVGGDAALYFDPNSEEEMKNTMKKLIDDSELRAQLIRKGKERLSLYSWERCAKETLEVLEEAAKS